MAPQMPMTTEMRKISNTTQWCCDGMALRPCTDKANEGGKSCCKKKCRADWSTEKEPLLGEGAVVMRARELGRSKERMAQKYGQKEPERR